MLNAFVSILYLLFHGNNAKTATKNPFSHIVLDFTIPLYNAIKENYFGDNRTKTHTIRSKNRI